MVVVVVVAGCSWSQKEPVQANVFIAELCPFRMTCGCIPAMVGEWTDRLNWYSCRVFDSFTNGTWILPTLVYLGALS